MIKRYLLIDQWTKNFALLAAAVFATGVFFGIQLTLFNNFIVTRLEIEPHHLGYVEALREVPGFLNVLFIALMMRMAVPMLAGISLIVMGLGIIAYAQVFSVFSLALISFIWSLGFHCWLPLEQTMALQFSPDEQKGKWLGVLRSVMGVAWLISIGFCIFSFSSFGYGGLFVVAGLVTAAGGMAIFFSDTPRSSEPEQRFVFKRRYALFYWLQLLQGFRRQMFITFAIFALVKVHGMPVKTTMILVFINQLLITLTGPLMGRLVDRFGERLMLSSSYTGLIFVFLGYAFVTHRPTLYSLYCVDNLLFVGGIALTTYLNRIAPPEDLKLTFSMGVTMNHVSAVIAPLVGGLAWYFFGYQVIFIAGAILAFISLIVSQRID